MVKDIKMKINLKWIMKQSLGTCNTLSKFYVRVPESFLLEIGQLVLINLMLKAIG